MLHIEYTGDNRYDIWDFIVGDESYTSCHMRDDGTLTVRVSNTQTLVINKNDTVICLDKATKTFMICSPQQMLFLAM